MDPRIAGMARFGVVDLRGHQQLDLTRRELRNQLVIAGCHFPLPGVAVLPGAPETFEQRVAMMLASHGGRALAGLWTAAFLHGMVRKPPGAVHVLLPRDRQPDARPGERLFSARNLTLADQILVRGLPCTTPARTVCDLARFLDVGALRNLVIDARQRRLLTLGGLATVRSRLAYMKGGPRIDRVLADLTRSPVDSGFEWEVRDYAISCGLRPHDGVFPTRCPDGRIVHLDIAFPVQWVSVETESIVHLRHDTLEADHRRSNQLVRHWSLFRVGWARFRKEPNAVIAELAALLANARPGRPPAEPADCACPACDRG